MFIFILEESSTTSVSQISNRLVSDKFNSNKELGWDFLVSMWHNRGLFSNASHFRVSNNCTGVDNYQALIKYDQWSVKRGVKKKTQIMILSANFLTYKRRTQQRNQTFIHSTLQRKFKLLTNTGLQQTRCQYHTNRVCKIHVCICDLWSASWVDAMYKHVRCREEKLFLVGCCRHQLTAAAHVWQTRPTYRQRPATHPSFRPSSRLPSNYTVLLQYLHYFSY